MDDFSNNKSALDPQLIKHRRSSRLNMDDDEIFAMFEADGCQPIRIYREVVLTGTRRRVYKRVEYIASCGHPNDIRLLKYSQGRGRLCHRCAHPRGEKHVAYNPNKTDEERIAGRDQFANVQWRKAVYDRDNYTCQVCGDSRGGNLVAHHLDSYADFPEERFNVENGITLCEDCHKRFHHEYTYYHSTREKFEEWIEHDNTEATA